MLTWHFGCGCLQYLGPQPEVSDMDTWIQVSRQQRSNLTCVFLTISTSTSVPDFKQTALEVWPKGKVFLLPNCWAIFFCILLPAIGELTKKIAIFVYKIVTWCLPFNCLDFWANFHHIAQGKIRLNKTVGFCKNKSRVVMALEGGNWFKEVLLLGL